MNKQEKEKIKEKYLTWELVDKFLETTKGETIWCLLDDLIKKVRKDTIQEMQKEFDELKKSRERLQMLIDSMGSDYRELENKLKEKDKEKLNLKKYCETRLEQKDKLREKMQKRIEENKERLNKCGNKEKSLLRHEIEILKSLLESENEEDNSGSPLSLSEDNVMEKFRVKECKSTSSENSKKERV